MPTLLGCFKDVHVHNIRMHVSVCMYMPHRSLYTCVCIYSGYSCMHSMLRKFSIDGSYGCFGFS